MKILVIVIVNVNSTSFTTFEVLGKTFPGTSVVLYILKTGSHRNA